MAHHATGTVLNYMARFERSEFHFLRALELNPLEVTISTDYANLLLHTGRNAEALAIVEELQRRDPYPPTWMHFVHGKVLFFSGRFEEAIRALDNGSPWMFRAHGLLAAAHAMNGSSEEARRHVELMKVAKPDIRFEVFSATLPFADRSALDFLRDALRKAGFDD